MKRNADPRIVVMDRDVYDRLRDLAGIGTREVGGSLKEADRHVRRFNPAVATEAKAERDAEAEQIRQARSAAFDLLKRKAGKTIYTARRFTVPLPSVPVSSFIPIPRPAHPRAKQPKETGCQDERLQSAVFNYVKALRSLGKTYVNSVDVARALNVPRGEAEAALQALQKHGVEIIK